MLNPYKSVQESSEEMLDFKTQQLARQIAYIEIYKNQFFRFDFTPIHVYMFSLSFLTTLNIYKDYFKGRHN